jgi:signal transduction histidine kinase
MKRTLPIIVLLLSIHSANCQFHVVDSLKNVLRTPQDENGRLGTLDQLFFRYLFYYPDSSLPYLRETTQLANQIHSYQAKGLILGETGWFYVIKGDYIDALRSFTDALKLAEKNNDFIMRAEANDIIGVIYDNMEDYSRGLAFHWEGKKIMESNWKVSLSKPFSDTLIRYVRVLFGLLSSLQLNDQLDSALILAPIIDTVLQMDDGERYPALAFELGNIYTKKSKFPLAYETYRSGIVESKNYYINKDLIDNYNGIAKAFNLNGNVDSSIFYAKLALDVCKVAKYSIAELTALNLLANIYKRTNHVDSLAKYLQRSIAVRDSLFSLQKIMQIQAFDLGEQKLKMELDDQRRQIQNRTRTYFLLGGLATFLLIATILYRNNVHKQRAFSLLQKQKQEIGGQKARIEKTLEELKTTQKQLIQSEKMASLGELTAGIAHEIQNPLNFVNNFSEVNNELVEELQNEIRSGHMEVALGLSNTIRDNEQKISHHGKRADAIVKGMLQHSRGGTGQKEPTNLNSLADEYLRLCYHGFRAKDKSFNARVETHFDPTLPSLDLVVQDIGRVFLNLLTNAFYSVLTKAKLSLNGYQPKVDVSTKLYDHFVEVGIKDNGLGISPRNLDKIFNPFFTTKPGGEGTGLGLSLSYEIITKEHGGEIHVNTVEGEFAEFIIRLPLKSTEVKIGTI